MTEKTRRHIVVFRSVIDTQDPDAAVEAFMAKMKRVVKDMGYLTIDVRETSTHTTLHLTTGSSHNSEPDPICEICDGVGRVSDTQKHVEHVRYLELRQEIELLSASLADWYGKWVCHSVDDADDAIRHVRDQLQWMVSKIESRHDLPFKYKILLQGGLELADVFNGIGIRTDVGMFGICQRDGGIEVTLNHEFVGSVQGVPEVPVHIGRDGTILSRGGADDEADAAR